MPNTPNRSYPYPAQSDPPAGHTQIQSLATAVDSDMVTQMARISSLETGSAIKAYRVTTNNAQGISANTDTVMLFGPPDYNENGACTYNSGVITLNATGLWALSGTIQTNVTGGAAYVWIGHGSNTAASDRYALSVEPTAGISAHCLYTERFFTSGNTVALWFWGQSGTVTTVVTETNTTFTARYLGNP